MSKAKASPQQWLAAIAVGGIAFWAPGEENGFFFRVIASGIALAVLVLAAVGLELLLEYKKTAEQPKANPFEMQTRKIELPIAPPGGVFGAASAMAELLDGFPVDINSRVTTTETGFQIITGKERLRAKVAAGTAIGWEHDSTCWQTKRDEWIEAVQAAPRCREVRSVQWMGISTLEPPPTPEAQFEVGETLVRIDGLSSKPHLNGKLGIVTRAINEAGRVGVRPEGTKESMLLPTGKIAPLPAFDRTGVSIPCLRSFRATLEPLLSGLTVAEALNSVVRPMTLSWCAPAP